MTADRLLRELVEGHEAHMIGEDTWQRVYAYLALPAQVPRGLIRLTINPGDSQERECYVRGWNAVIDAATGNAPAAQVPTYDEMVHARDALNLRIAEIDLLNSFGDAATGKGTGKTT